MKAGWEIKTVSEVAKHSLGKMLDKAKNKGTPRDYLRNVNVRWFAFDLSDLLQMRFLEDEEPKFTATKGDVLICEGGYPGRAAVWDEDYPIHFQKAIHRVRFHEPERNKWFVYHLYYLDLSGELRQYFTGTGIQHFTGETLARLPIPFPPLSEQRRIVGILDEAFEGLATAKANAEQNLQNTRALFESHLQAVFTQRGHGWVEKPFDDLIESNVIGLTKSSREQGDDKAWPYVKMNNITRDNRFDFSNFTSVDATDEEVRKFALENGDFLFNTRNSFELVGKSCIYESDLDGVVLFNNNIMRVRFKPGTDAHFVLLAFSSKVVGAALSALKSGTTNVSAIYFKDLKSLMIPVPPIARQKQIAGELARLSAETQRLESLYQRKLAAIDELKKSLLHRAFSGQL